jgi:hypothetical protein
MSVYVPSQPGDRLDGMEWTGVDWAPICPEDDVAMTEYNERAELCCPVCGVSLIAYGRASR